MQALGVVSEFSATGFLSMGYVKLDFHALHVLFFLCFFSGVVWHATRSAWHLAVYC